jgi:hypothetical protein
MDKDGIEIVGGTLGCVLLVLTWPLALVVDGWALKILWAWFIVPVFHLPYLTIGQAIGIACVVGLLWHKPEKECKCKDKEEEGLLKIVGTALFELFGAPLISLVLGWFVKAWLLGIA